MIRVADYIAQTLARHGVRHVFMVTGGGAMHLNDAFGRCHPDLAVVCCHHEQACAMAAESYYRVTGRMAAVNVTTGPGGTNAITGVYGAYVDSMAMIVVSGQVKWETLVRSTDLPLRQLGDQEVDIVRMVGGVTKYAVLVKEPSSIRYHLERALHLATNGRPGPVWLDVPINVQGAKIDPATLSGYDPAEDAPRFETRELDAAVQHVAERLRTAERPVIYAGTGIRLSGQYETFLRLAGRLGIPIATAWNSNDLLPDEHPAYAGRPGSIGNRAGNFTVQNSDCLLVLGSRLNIRLVSYNWENFARQAYKIAVDVDAAELKKPTLKIDYPVHADLRDFLPALDRATADWSPRHVSWLAWCRERVKRYPVVLAEYWTLPERVNPYCFMDRLFAHLQEREIVVCGDGTACVTAFQAATIRAGQRLFHNSGCAAMGYDLPAAIGVATARPDLARVICLAGDGSIMMNLQELQTIAGRRLPVKLFVLNNSGYHSIRQTQANFFSDNIVGCGTDSGLSFPDFGRVAEAFGFSFQRCARHSDLEATITATLNARGAAMCEVVLDLAQAFAPKLSSRKLEDGRMITAPLEDMAPFLSRQELESNMLVPLLSS
ncbi:MAG: thiamine pyrophosphate-binding protein [Opitutaceae bacterium]|jgi:acetolactate synthase-1/2/3 large subunit